MSIIEPGLNHVDRLDLRPRLVSIDSEVPGKSLLVSKTGTLLVHLPWGNRALVEAKLELDHLWPRVVATDLPELVVCS